MAFTLDSSLARGAWGNALPSPGSSNISGALAGKFSGQLGYDFSQIPKEIKESEAFQKNPVGTLQQYLDIPVNQQLTQSMLQQFDPGFQHQKQKQEIDTYLAYAKQLGDQQMKYRMTNDIIANLGSAARSAFARYTDPGAIANRIGGIGTAYAQGLQASSGLAQLGANNPNVKYYSV